LCSANLVRYGSVQWNSRIRRRLSGKKAALLPAAVIRLVIADDHAIAKVVYFIWPEFPETVSCCS